jgi:hypothetical protein
MVKSIGRLLPITLISCQTWLKYWETFAKNFDFMHSLYSFEDAIEPRKNKLGIKDGILNPEKIKLGTKNRILNPEKIKLGIKYVILNPEKINWASKMGYQTQKK